ncbi:glutaredoxin family protein [Paenibacillus apiarius]|uniref:Glutaredoxin family protein n=1 Tax=Paenibacillus apiarius TaxID=46240 RepID=A0ABT4DTX7_9BACL|nr:glutaredoxin family protein [Paenibacillus apiarius]MCY9516334.1 glutaredoxin family protein [Paenibacillus apiarius]MCY9519568.1 glutaredoxin family protein [Paenibacillus apiarius]MCY9554670.1 glutaredoxin family protein [Paenibacillus apiarius]MCY9561503.1 glutaredoxin family protein [Paenibacillus apiarius]MCY9684266.1 glutaredoxin family protein [Paenibacillus apiarius]
MSANEKVIVYSSTHCQYCTQVKKFLNDKGVEFEERNIDKDETYAEELWNTGMRSVPVTVIGDAKILGFNQIQLNKALAERQ